MTDSLAKGSPTSRFLTPSRLLITYPTVGRMQANLVDLTSASWNPVIRWPRQLEALRRAA